MGLAPAAAAERFLLEGVASEGEFKPWAWYPARDWLVGCRSPNEKSERLQFISSSTAWGLSRDIWLMMGA